MRVCFFSLTLFHPLPSFPYFFATSSCGECAKSWVWSGEGTQSGSNGLAFLWGKPNQETGKTRLGPRMALVGPYTAKSLT